MIITSIAELHALTLFKPNFPKMPPMMFVSMSWTEKCLFPGFTYELTQPDGVEQLCDETEDL